jgi:hypothetical protein
LTAGGVVRVRKLVDNSEGFLYHEVQRWVFGTVATQYYFQVISFPTPESSCSCQFLPQMTEHWLLPWTMHEPTA